MSDIKVIFLLFLLFQTKHFFCDYLLQTEYMLGKFKPDWGFVKPLMAHSGVNAFFTFQVVMCHKLLYNEELSLWYLFLIPLFDFVTHFIVDRIKASPNLLGRFSKDDKYFWWTLGLTQFVHHMVHWAMILFLVYDF